MGLVFSPFAPGTVGALVALLIWWLFAQSWPAFETHSSFQFLIILIACIIGTWSSDKLEVVWGKDPSKVVVDELAGMWISLFLIPINNLNLILGFIIFRLLDIFKPLGVRKGEDLPGGLGIMADDVIAGIYTNLILQLLIALEWIA